ncbi:MAG TPA: YafY family protein [Opitutus sp.]|nr:YafY family protein [Opitutus sp.]
MNRTDRLVAMVLFLQGRRVVRAEELARHFEVNIRTIYRDVAALGEAGVPVIGEAGVGYSLMKGYHLPPVMFTTEEAVAMFVGGEMVKQFADASMTAPMETALLKIRSVLPLDRRDDLDRLARATAIYGDAKPPDGLDQRTLLPIQQAIVSRRVLRMTYHGIERNADTVRDAEPLGVTFRNGAWYLVAWCRLRKDYRYFKLERLRSLEVLGERFAARPEFSLRDFLKEQSGGEPQIPARVWFSREGIERVRREALAGELKAAPARDGFEVELAAFSLEWLARRILAYGPDAEALAPEKLRALVRAEAEAVARRHG